MACLEDTKTLGHDGKPCCPRFIIYIEGKSRHCRKPGVGGCGESLRQFGPPRSPESAYAGLRCYRAYACSWAWSRFSRTEPNRSPQASQRHQRDCSGSGSGSSLKARAASTMSSAVSVMTASRSSVTGALKPNTAVRQWTPDKLPQCQAARHHPVPRPRSHPSDRDAAAPGRAPGRGLG